MDTSKEYIKMCEEAKEIQKEWKPRRGDIVGRKACSPWKPRDGFSYDCMVVTAWGDNHLEDIDKPEITTVLLYYMRNHIGWSSLYPDSIKKQNNLYLDMMYIGKDMFFYEHERKDLRWLPRQDQLQEMAPNWLVDNIDAQFNSFVVLYCYNQFTSWEQLWLAFLMSEKYQKEWNGKHWTIKVE